MKQAEIAREAGVSESYISQVKRGVRPPSKRLIPYLNLLDPNSKALYFQQRHKGLDDHFKVAIDMDELVSYHMETPIEIFIEIPTTKPIAVCNTADWHVGEPGCDYKQLQKDVKVWSNTEGLYTAIGGDGTQNIIQPSKMGSSQNQLPVAVQKAMQVQIYEACAANNLYVSTGNHDYWSTLAVGEDWNAELSQRLRMVYTKHSAKIYLKVGKIVYTIVRMHKGRFNSRLNLTHSPKQHQRQDFPDARVLVVEHDHLAAIEQYRYNDQECCAIRTGTYAVKSDFALQNGFYGAHVSNPTVVFYPDRDHLVGFKDMHDAIIYLRTVRNDN